MNIEFINEPTISDLLKVIKYVNRNLKQNTFLKIATNETLTEDYAILWHQKFKLCEQIYSIATIEKNIVGVSHLDIFHGRRKHGGKLAITVDFDYRRKGTGDLLLKNIIQQCKSKGIFLIRAEPTEDNSIMIHLLEKNGFLVEGRCKKAFSDDKKGFIDLIEYTLFIE